MSKEIHLDLCAGIAGFSLATEWTWPGRFEHAFCEIDPYCQRVIHKHWPGATIHDDLRTMDGRRYAGRVGLLTAGIPCQPYSVAGKRGGDEDDRALWPAARRIISEARPRWVCIENVVGFIGLALDGVLADLEREGYAVGAAVLPACAVGAPHRRDRVWIIAHHEGAADGAYLAESGGRQAQQPRNGAESANVADANGRDAERRRVTRDVACASAGVEGEAREWQRGGDAIGDRSEAPANADSGGRGRQPGEQGKGSTERGRTREDGKAAPGPACQLPHGAGTTPICSGGKRGIESRLGGGDDDVPARMDFPRIDRERYLSDEWESGIPRVVTEKVPNRTHRLKALGNAIVPVVAYEIFRAIKEVDH